MYHNTVRTAQSAVASRGCGVNVCFAVDTSGSVSKTQFGLEKDFILDITAIIGVDSRSKFAAGQYGARTYKISSLTSDVSGFNLDVNRADFQNDPATSVGSGIVFCDRQLRRERGDANKIVVIGDGRNNLGGDPVRRADNFRKRTGGEVSTVGIGFKDTRALTAIAGSKARVFSIDDYVELSFIIEDLVYDICGIPLDI